MAGSTDKAKWQQIRHKSMSNVTIFHNPRCSKSRQALALLQEAGITPEIRLYLEDVPSKALLREVLGKLALSASDVLRKNEDAYKTHFTGITDDERLITLLTHYPKVLERPIVITQDSAVIGRPPENVLGLITS